MKRFTFYFSGVETLTADQIWPNGDGPINPTVADVRAEFAKAGRPASAARDWGIDDALIVDIVEMFGGART